MFTIFVERSGSLFADDDILMWLREIIGFCLNKIDEDDFSDVFTDIHESLDMFKRFKKYN